MFVVDMTVKVLALMSANHMDSWPCGAPQPIFKHYSAVSLLIQIVCKPNPNLLFEIPI